MSYNVRIDDNFLRADHVDGEVLQHTDLNELESVAKTAINANYEDIQKLQDGTTVIANSEKFDGATLSKFATETLQNSDTKVPTSMQTKQYVDTAIDAIDLSGYYTSREIDTLLQDKVAFTDYPTNDGTKSGVIKVNATDGISVNTNNKRLQAVNTDYGTYSSASNSYIIGKGTLENVITGKNLETANNKVTSVNGSSTDTQYPSAKWLYDNYYKKTDLATVATSGNYNDLSNKPTIPTVNNATLTIQKNGTTVDTFTANSSTNKTVNITVPTKTSDITNDSNFVSKTDYATTTTGGVFKAGNSATVNSSGQIQAAISTYSTYRSTLSQNAFISKGTLENVIAGKGLVHDTKIKTTTNTTQGNIYDVTYINSQLGYKEDVANKVTTISSSSTDDEYPSAKCVYDLIGDLETILETLDTGNGVSLDLGNEALLQ